MVPEPFGQVEQLIAERSDMDGYDLLLKQAKNVAPGAEGLLFLPYLMGERTPHLDPGARGAWLGLHWRHEASHLIRDVLEGVAFSLRDVWEVIQNLGIEASIWKVSGGGAQGRLWMDIFATVVQRKLEIIQASHGPAI